MEKFHKSRRDWIIVTKANMQYIMKRLILMTAWVILSCGIALPQTPDDIYRKPLKQVLQDVEKRFNIKLSYDEKLMRDKVVSFAYWRMRSDPEATLHSILGPQDMVFSKKDSGIYEITAFQYHRRPSGTLR